MRPVTFLKYSQTTLYLISHLISAKPLLNKRETHAFVPLDVKQIRFQTAAAGSSRGIIQTFSFQKGTPYALKCILAKQEEHCL